MLYKLVIEIAQFEFCEPFMMFFATQYFPVSQFNTGVKRVLEISRHMLERIR